MSVERINGMLSLLQDHGYTLVDLGELLTLVETLKVDEDYLASMQMIEQDKKQDLDLRITYLLKEIGIPANILGYRYVREAVALTYKDPSYIRKITTLLYPTLAKTFDSAPLRVERAIRHAIELAWDRGNTEVFNKYFGYTIDSSRGKPTNSEFISMMADYLQLHS